MKVFVRLLVSKLVIGNSNECGRFHTKQGATLKNRNTFTTSTLIVFKRNYSRKSNA